MELNTVKMFIEDMQKNKNAFFSITYEKELKTLKAYKDSRFWMKNTMSGLQCSVYDNKAKVKEGRERGLLPAENAGLPKGQEWYLYPYLVKMTKTGKIFLRCFMNENSKSRDTHYFKDGTEYASKESFRGMLQKSEFEHRNSDSGVIIVLREVDKIESIACNGKIYR